MHLDLAHSALKKYFGYDTFRPMQADIIQTVYDRRDALVLMPTGGGKSLCFQIPAITMEGVAVVVSPLIALMKDQVEGLRGNGVPAAFLNSSMSLDAVRKVEDALLAGQLKILYVSPEKLVSQGFQPLLKRLPISLFAIDEAHCISAWGHDFRQEYTQLAFLKAQYPNTPILALTATADKLTRKDILSQLHLQDPAVFVASFDRPNISLNVRSGRQKFEQIIDFILQRRGQSGIIYCLARRTCVDLAEKLSARGIKAAPYHAELPAALRNQVQEDFINDRTPVICATIAFGMGIDKSNVRYIIHYNLPRNLEGYYQEIGRAGRDGLPAEALLFFSYNDVQAYRQMIEESEAAQEQKDLKIAKLERMYQFAEAPVCRRQMVLSYFGEHYEQRCGNCDICRNPPKAFDGTVAVQKALSAILRSGEKIGMNLLVDVLRGSRRQEIFQQNLHQIKTYGAGKEYSFDDWLYLLSQMLHLGFIEIAYDDFNRLRVTEAGRNVLFEQKQVSLALPNIPKAAVPEAQQAPPAQFLRKELFDRLSKLRRQIAQQEGVPPYIIFSDASLDDMAEKRPVTDAELLSISGMGERKLHRYGDRVIAEIRQFVLEKSAEGVKIKGGSCLQTLDLFRKGIAPEEIARMRSISNYSVLDHLITMYEKGEDIDPKHWVSPEEIDLIQGAFPLFSPPYKLQEIYTHFEERFNYDKIRWALAVMNRK
jgi:ATP-dependent DNA helicase RecQ